jgi:hypothetical protein
MSKARSVACAALFAIATVGCAAADHAPADHAQQAASPSVEPFEFVVESTPDGVALEARSGTDWKAVRWTSSQQGGSKGFYLSRAGIASRPEDLSSDGFCIAVDKTDEGFVMKSLRQTNWLRLKYDCGESKTCRFVVTESGVHTLQR